MPASADPVALLLAELKCHGIVITAHGEKLRYRPRDRLTPELASRLKALKSDLLPLLGAADGQVDRVPASEAVPDRAIYTPRECGVLAAAGVRPGDLRLVDQVKLTFPRAMVIGARRSAPDPRRQAADLIRRARRGNDARLAVLLRDAWCERIALCTVDGALPVKDAEAVAIKELQMIVD
jgi:hypothetical protein